MSEGAAVTLRPNAPLDRSRSYTASLPSGAVTDRAGNPFAGASGGTQCGLVFTTAR